MCAILVTGGAGFIGSVTVQALLERGMMDVHVLDHLGTGHRQSVDQRTPLHEVDLTDRDRVVALVEKIRPQAVIHFAATSLVGPSVRDPLPTYANNLVGAIHLLEAMKRVGCDRLVFSSTAAVYGEPQVVPIPESHPVAPANPYGYSKATIERLIADCHQAYGLRAVVLRYFNAAGAVEGRGEDHRPETHLIPLVLQAALGQIPAISVFGNDYETPDGTAIRDYIHVADLASAHLAALDWLDRGGQTLTCNLGTGHGYSVQEVIDTARQVTGRPIPVQYGPRRAGDPSRLVAAVDRAAEVLQWKARHSDLVTILTDAWNWHHRHPQGYGDLT